MAEKVKETFSWKIKLDLDGLKEGFNLEAAINYKRQLFEVYIPGDHSSHYKAIITEIPLKMMPQIIQILDFLLIKNEENGYGQSHKT